MPGGHATSSPSLYALDGVNFFLAAALAGFGPYVAAYLADQKWTQTDIGLVLTAGGVAGLLSQLPGGELLDKVRSKRAVIAVGASIVILGAFILAFWPRLFGAACVAVIGWHCVGAVAARVPCCLLRADVLFEIVKPTPRRRLKLRWRLGLRCWKYKWLKREQSLRHTMS